MAGFVEYSIWWIMVMSAAVLSKPIGECKTYFSIIGLEGSALNGSDICSRKEIPFVYFVLKCNDSDSLKCAKNLQWSALSVCDKVNVHHEEIPLTRTFDSIESDSELSMEISLYIQYEDEVNEVDDFSIKTTVDPNHDNAKTYVDTVGKQHNTKLEVEFHRVCNLPDHLKNPFQVISYILTKHPNLRQKRQAEFATPEVQSSTAVGNEENGKVSDLHVYPSMQNEQVLAIPGNGLLNTNLNQPRTVYRTDEFVSSFKPSPSAISTVQDFWDSVGSKMPGSTSRKLNTQQSSSSLPSPSPTSQSLREENITTQIDTTEGDRKTPDVTDGITSETTELTFLTTDGDTTEPVTTEIATSGTTMKPSATTSKSPFTPAPTTRSPSTRVPGTPRPAKTTTDSITESSTPKPPQTTTQLAEETKSTSTVKTSTSDKFELSTNAITTDETTTRSTVLITRTTPRPATTRVSTTPKPVPTSSTESITTQATSTDTSEVTSQTTTSATTQASTKDSPTVTKGTSTVVNSQHTTDKSTVVTKDSVDARKTTASNIFTEPSLNTPFPSVEPGTAASSSVLGMDQMKPEADDSGDSFWPIVAALVIGIPSVIVFGIAITVIHKKRLGRPPRFMSSSMYPSL